MPGVRWFALQKGDGHRDIEALAASPAGLPAHLIDLDAEITDFTDTAGNARSGGVAHLFGIDLRLETRDAL